MSLPSKKRVVKAITPRTLLYLVSVSLNRESIQYPSSAIRIAFSYAERNQNLRQNQAKGGPKEKKIKQK